MNTWKLTIKPASKDGYNAFELCKSKSFLGIGWSSAYIEKHPSTLDEAKKLVKNKYNKWPSAIKTLLEKVQEGDHIWLHKGGKYYLCKAGREILYGPEIHEDFREYDLGHCRKASWVEVPEVFVSGSIQRGTIAQRMIQKIKITKEEHCVHEMLFNKLVFEPNWKPIVNVEVYEKKMPRIGVYEFFSLTTPDDVEDIISAYLQSKGWILIKSTCYRSKPEFEFMMQNREMQTCHVQVKSGKEPECLEPSDYAHHVSTDKVIYLFSTNRRAYAGPRVDGIHCISHHEIFHWVKNNSWALTEPLKQRLWIYLSEND